MDCCLTAPADTVEQINLKASAAEHLSITIQPSSFRFYEFNIATVSLPCRCRNSVKISLKYLGSCSIDGQHESNSSAYSQLCPLAMPAYSPTSEPTGKNSETLLSIQFILQWGIVTTSLWANWWGWPYCNWRACTAVVLGSDWWQQDWAISVVHGSDQLMEVESRTGPALRVTLWDCSQNVHWSLQDC